MASPLSIWHPFSPWLKTHLILPWKLSYAHRDTLCRCGSRHPNCRKNLWKYGVPVYVCHEIVPYNKFVVETLRSKRCCVYWSRNSWIIMIDLWFFLAHGVPKLSFLLTHRNAICLYIDATLAPLVTKVHRIPQDTMQMGSIYPDHYNGHPKWVTIMGQLPRQSVFLVVSRRCCSEISLIQPRKPLQSNNSFRWWYLYDCRGSWTKISVSAIPVEDICYSYHQQARSRRGNCSEFWCSVCYRFTPSNPFKLLGRSCQIHGCPKAFWFQDESDIPWIGSLIFEHWGWRTMRLCPDILIDKLLPHWGKFPVKGLKKINQEGKCHV